MKQPHTLSPDRIKVGRSYTPYRDRKVMRLKLVKEDSSFYYFEDKTKYSKPLPFYWYEVTPLLKVRAYISSKYTRQKNKYKRRAQDKNTL